MKFILYCNFLDRNSYPSTTPRWQLPYNALLFEIALCVTAQKISLIELKFLFFRSYIILLAMRTTPYSTERTIMLPTPLQYVYLCIILCFGVRRTSFYCSNYHIVERSDWLRTVHKVTEWVRFRNAYVMKGEKSQKQFS